MDTQKQKKLFNDFPVLYRDAINQPSIYQQFGGFFWCRSGWFDLLYNLSAAIEKQAQAEGIDPASEQYPNITTVKEKGGILVFNGRGLFNWSKDIKALIATAKEQSEHTCDLCGMPGVMRTNGGWRVRCDSHADTQPGIGW